ncbi:uncharacterized protein LOC105432881 [Pogonomyrmex barbatus]|uniref:Uncharacterized protein LOC105432881 n=1 Tax=Pogonomyrmex barbatus TaxID=144034 RepID=A0A6I9WQU9_9HYME|nr:uncharacterized protein LOC105432881 [Pogonomyrmex barbatus]
MQAICSVFFKLSKQMEQVDPEEHYYKLNRFLLSVSGLWPYQNEWSARLMRAIITFIMLTSTIFQLASMFTSDLTLDFIVDLIPLVILTLGTLTNLFSRILHIDKVSRSSQFTFFKIEI